MKTMRLNKKSPVPLYHQLADIIKARIESGEYPTGDRIPTETGLAATYKIGRPTVRQAIELLTQKGMLERKRGSGTYVLEKKKEIDLFSLAGTSSAFHKKYISIELEILKEISLVTEIIDSENPFYRNHAWFFSRLTRARNKPVLIEDIYLHADIFKGIENIDLHSKSLAKVVKDHFYMEPVTCRQTFSTEKLFSKKAESLKVPVGEPILLVKRYLHFPQMENAIYSEIIARTDSFVFSQTITA